jgi:predicted HAD superfamily Cof-like phosphohydrolase
MYCEKVRQFSQLANNNKLPNTPQVLQTPAIEFITKMVNDELQELKDAKNTSEQADALVDAIYYLCDTACRHGINLDPIFDIVHKANLTKVKNKIIKSTEGKVEKPVDWVDPIVDVNIEICKQTEFGSFII